MHPAFFAGVRVAAAGEREHALLKRCLRRSATAPRVSNGDQVNRVAALAMKRGKSVDFTGYWQRHIASS